MKPKGTDTHAPRGKLNPGLWLAHPIESSYARARRAITANPAAGLARINRQFSAWGPHRVTEGLEARLPGTLTCTQPRQCPECARHLFHPAIYQLPALRRCPIHHQAFTSHCPVCNQRWNRPLRERWPRCERCGIPGWSGLANLQLPKRAYRRVMWLEHWAQRTVRDRQAHPRIELIDVRALTDWVGTMERPRLQAPALDHPFYLAFEAAKRQPKWMLRLNELEGVTFTAPLHRRLTTLRPWQPEPHQAWLRGAAPADSIPRYSKTFIQLAIRRLLSWQAKTLRFPHALTWRDYSRMRPDEYLASGHLCPVCWAFSLWLPALMLKFSHPRGQSPFGTAVTHEACRYTYYDHFPVTPEAVAVERSPGQWLLPSASFERWLYLRSCDYLFLELVHLATWFRHRLRHKPSHYSLTIYHCSHRFTVPALASQLMDVETSADYRQLVATYPYASPLDELKDLPEIYNLPVNCPSQREADAPLVWEIPAGCLHPSAAEFRSLFKVLIPRFKALSTGYNWASDTWSPWSERPHPDIDDRVCMAAIG